MPKIQNNIAYTCILHYITHTELCYIWNNNNSVYFIPDFRIVRLMSAPLCIEPGKKNKKIVTLDRKKRAVNANVYETKGYGHSFLIILYCIPCPKDILFSTHLEVIS